MKKYITIAALLAAGTAFANAEQTIESGSYTLITSAQWTLGEDSLYNYLYGAFNEGGKLEFDLDITKNAGTPSAEQAILHVGQKDNGFSIYVDTDFSLIVSPNNSTSDDYKFSGVTLASGSNDVKVTIEGGATVGTASIALSVNGASASKTLDLTWSSMTWATGTDEHGSFNAKYSVNCMAPGWNNNSATITPLTAGTATFTAVPEPSAFGMLAGLGALALVASRRRRK